MPDNPYVVEPLIAGNALPNAGWRRTFASRELRSAFNGEQTNVDWHGSGISYYYPLHNSNEEIVGVLELLVGRGWHKDVDTTEMFVEKLEPQDDED